MFKKVVIVFEGIESSGKTSHCRFISKYLKKKKIDHVTIREPGGSQNSEKIKQSAENADASTVVGATKEDLERMGISSPSEDKGVSLSQEAAKKGGKLSYKIH